MPKIIHHDFTVEATDKPAPTPSKPEKLRWTGIITAIQPRAWVWRYKTCNRRHNHTGFNLWIRCPVGKLIVAISGLQQEKVAFRIGDRVSGTGKLVLTKKREIAEIYRAGDLTVLERSKPSAPSDGPPFTGPVPPLSVYEQRGCRMLDSTLWRTTCMTCKWANKARVEIEYVWGKKRRYRSETFCYGPKSCPVYEMGPPREVPYQEVWKSEGSKDLDEGSLDSCLTSGRGEDE